MKSVPGPLRVELVEDFSKFLGDEVNLNRTRITELETHVENIQKFLNGSDWGAPIIRYSNQGSWAHKTIIKPPGSGGFDADVLVFVKPVTDWSPDDYIHHLRRVFRGSGIYKDKASLNTRCVTITYAGDFEIDIVPCVTDRPGGTYRFEICNRVEESFEPTDSEAYTAWLADRNGWVGNDRLREVTRLLKYLRDIKQTFTCKSILLTTLIGNLVTPADAVYHNAYFPDPPTALKTLIGRVDDYLQEHPELHEVNNPVLQRESFTRHWDDDKYANFRDVIDRYREWIDDAYDEPDQSESRRKWQRVFGDEFGKGAKRALMIENASALPMPASNSNVKDTVQAVQVFGKGVLARVQQAVPWMKPPVWTQAANQAVLINATAHYDRTGKQLIGPFEPGTVLKKGLELRFIAVARNGVPYSGKDVVDRPGRTLHLGAWRPSAVLLRHQLPRRRRERRDHRRRSEHGGASGRADCG